MIMNTAGALADACRTLVLRRAGIPHWHLSRARPSLAESCYDDEAGRSGSLLRFVSQFLHGHVVELTYLRSIRNARLRLSSYNASLLFDCVSQGLQVAKAKE